MSGKREVKVVILGDGKSLKRATGQANKDMGSLGKGVQRIGGVIAKVAKVGVVAAAAAGVAILSIGMKYQDSLNTFQSVSSATAAQMDRVGKRAKQLGNDLTLPGTSAADAASAMVELSKSGLSVEESMDAAAGTIRLALAATIDEATAAGITANALSVYGLKGSDAAKVSDILAAAANSSSAEIMDVAESLKYVGPFADALSVSLADTSAAIGVLANKGIKGSQAGTSLRGMLASLANPSRKAARGLARLGIDAFDANGKFVGLHSMTEQLHKAQGRLTEQQFAQGAAMAFGREPLAAVVALAKGGATEFDKMTVAVGKQGAAGQVAAAKSRGLRGALDALRSVVETIAITVYEKVSPAIEGFVRKATENIPRIIAVMGDVVKRVGEVVSAFADSDTVERMVEAFGRLVDVGSRVVKEVLTQIGEWWDKHGETVVDIAERMASAIATAIGKVVSALEWLVEHWNGVRNTVLIVAKVIAAVLIPHFIRLGVQALISGGRQAASWVMGSVASVRAAAVSVISSYRIVAAWVAQGVAAVVSGAQTAYVWLLYKAEAIKGAAIYVAQLVRMAAGHIAHGIAVVASTVATVATVVAGWVLMGIQSLLGAAKIDSLPDIIRHTGPIGWAMAAIALVALVVWRNWDKVKKYTSIAWKWVSDKVMGAVRFMVKLFTNFTGPGLIIKHFTKIKEVIGKALAWVKERFNRVLGWFRNLSPPSFSGFFDGIKGAFKSAINAVIGWWNGLEFSIPKIHIKGTNKDFGGGSFGTPNIPYLAKGGDFASAGLAIVGENGPEILSGPKGARVTPLGRATSSASSDSVTVYVHVAGSVITERNLARSVAAEVRDELLRKGNRNGGRTGL